MRTPTSDSLEGWDEAQEGGTYMYLWLTHADLWWKPTQYCKVIILQLKVKLN